MLITRKLQGMGALAKFGYLALPQKTADFWKQVNRLKTKVHLKNEHELLSQISGLTHKQCPECTEGLL